MQLIGYSPPQVDLDAIPGFRRAFTWTSASVQQTARRVVALATLIDRAGALLDDVAELRRSAEVIAGSLSELGASAAGIDQNARVGQLGVKIGTGWAKSLSFTTGQCPVMRYHRRLMMAIRSSSGV